MPEEKISKAWLKTRFHNTVGGNGIRQELNRMGLENDIPTSEYQSALNTAEEWRNTLEAMAEVATVAEQEHIKPLFDACQFAIKDLLLRFPEHWTQQKG